ncbi:flavodoxin family protein [Pectinatus frisingensis]|uniref:flavodoxin family protein n=1 Tax=Pectinatus frisingensis TaxID=865 RepID=UPI0018C4B839|nr:flavodoxin family protein [Pectinatus frisingensis]
MQKWLIVYSSNTGNTEQIAKAMFQVLGSEAADIYSIKEAPAVEQLPQYNIIAVGYWLTRGAPDKAVQQWLHNLSGKRVVLFQTHGTDKYSEHSVTAFARAASCLGDNCEVLGTFGCQGRINPVLLNKRLTLSADDPHAPTERNKKRWAMAAQHPDTTDLAEARQFIAAIRRKLILREKYQNTQQ